MIKTRLQATNGQYTGPFDVLKKIYSTEGGVKGFYKGLPPNLIGVTPEKAIKLVFKLFGSIIFINSNNSGCQ
jgi:solute carrier family 25 aspartate/glutamate transporter 12/13